MYDKSDIPAVAPWPGTIPFCWSTAFAPPSETFSMYQPAPRCPIGPSDIPWSSGIIRLLPLFRSFMRSIRIRLPIVITDITMLLCAIVAHYS
jgi:hypothetical protein